MSKNVIKEKAPGAILIRLEAYSRHATAELTGHDLEKHAALIVAAPELLAALHAIAGCPQAGPWLARLPMEGHGCSVWEAMMNAIKLAEGE